MIRTPQGHKIFLMSTAAALFLGALPPAAEHAKAAETSASSQKLVAVEEIVVTSRRREEKLQSVPISVTAFSENMLKQMSVETVGDVAGFTPNLARTAGPTGGNDGFFFIRGIGQVDSNPAADPGVGIYVDGVYLGRIQGASMDSLDISRVEVLRGPQGTLFGRNTIGGAINVVTADPGPDFSVKGSVKFGSRNRIDGKIGLNIPVADNLGIILTGMTRNQDGWGRNVYTGKTFGDIKNLEGRAKIVWDASSQLRVTISADGLRGRGGSQHQILVAFNPNAGPIPGTSPLGIPFPAGMGSYISSDPFKNFSSVQPRNDLDTWGVATTLAWKGDDVNVKGIFSYRHLKQYVNNDFDGGPYSFYDNFFNTKQHQLSGELQLSGRSFDNRLDWLVGFYGYDETVNHNNAICLGTNIGIPGVAQPLDGRCLRNNQMFDLTIKSWAAFGSFSYHLTNQLTATLGLRYTDEKKDQSFNFFLDNGAGVASFFGLPPLAYIPTLSPDNPFLTVPTNYKKTWNQLTPKFGLDYQATDNVMVYASYARGFKSGGFNGRPTPDASGNFLPIQAYNPEKVDTFEVGMKSDLLERRLRLNLSAFYSIYKDIQLLVLDPTSGFFNTANAGKNKITGLEAELTAVPIPDLEIFGGLGYMHDKYTELDPLTGIRPDAHLPVTPKWNFNIGAQYTIETQNLGSLALRTDYNYRSEVSYGATNNPYEMQAGYGLLNLRATYTIPNKTISVAAYGLNVTDKRYHSNAQDVLGPLGVAFASIGAPREWGMELSAHF